MSPHDLPDAGPAVIRRPRWLDGGLSIRPLRWLPAASLVLGGVVLSGCLDADVSVRVADDGAGTVSVGVSVDPLFTGEACTAPSDGQGEPTCEASNLEMPTTGLPVGVTVVSSESGRYTGRIEYAFADPGALSELLTADDEALLSAFSLVQDGSRWRLEGDWVPPPLDAETEAFLAELGPRSEPTLEFRIDPPGGVVDHNADGRRGGELRWRWRYFEGQTLRAVSDESRDDPPQLPAGVVAVAVLLAVGTLAGGVATLRESRRRLS